MEAIKVQLPQVGLPAQVVHRGTEMGNAKQTHLNHRIS